MEDKRGCEGGGSVRPGDWAASCWAVPDGWFIPASSPATDRTSTPLLPPSISITSSIGGPVSPRSKHSPNSHPNLLPDRDLHSSANTFTHTKQERWATADFRAHTPSPGTRQNERRCIRPLRQQTRCEAAPLRPPGWQAILHSESHLHLSHIKPPAAADQCVSRLYHDGYTTATLEIIKPLPWLSH